MSAVVASETAAYQSAPTTPALLQAPAHWQSVDFISDLHLQAGDDATFSVWRDYMRDSRADALFILGDLFEIWVGDDVLDDGADRGTSKAPTVGPGFALQCAEVLAAAARRMALYFMHGNRDFLLGTAYANACGMTLLDDPSVLDFAGQRWLLSHGDALCLEDRDYMTFRTQVRSKRWQQDFLAKPLTERQSIGRQLRTESEARKSSHQVNAVMQVDVDAAAARDWLHAAGTSTLIHGHTHKPAEHDLGKGQRRIVLSDWDGGASPARACILRLSKGARDGTAGDALIERLAATSA